MSKDGVERRSGDDRRSGEDRRDAATPIYDLDLHSRRVNGQRRQADRRDQDDS